MHSSDNHVVIFEYVCVCVCVCVVAKGKYNEIVIYALIMGDKLCIGQNFSSEMLTNAWHRISLIDLGII